MWNSPSEKQLAKIPMLYTTEKVPLEDKVIHMHFFIGSCDWYITEWDKEDRRFFGFAILNGDTQNAEWGYMSLDEMMEVKVKGFLEIDRDIHWKVRTAKEVDKIQAIYQWR